MSGLRRTNRGVAARARQDHAIQMPGLRRNRHRAHQGARGFRNRRCAPNNTRGRQVGRRNSIGIIEWQYDASRARMSPETSSSCSRSITTMMALCLLLRRFDIEARKNRTVFFRTFSLSTSTTLCASSRMIRSPRSPVRNPHAFPGYLQRIVITTMVEMMRQTSRAAPPDDLTDLIGDTRNEGLDILAVGLYLAQLPLPTVRTGPHTAVREANALRSRTGDRAI
jgi:hypothetical protein